MEMDNANDGGAVEEKSNANSAVGVADFFSNESQLMETLCYRSCIEKNDPTPFVVATEKAKNIITRIISRATAQKDKDETMASFIDTALLPLEEIRSSKPFPTDGTNGDLDTTIRLIEVQILLRIQFWSSLGSQFIRLYNNNTMNEFEKRRQCSHANEKKKKKRKKRKKNTKKGGSWHHIILLDDIIDLLSLAAMKLPESRPFSGFLQGCLDPSIADQSTASLMPQGIVQDIYDKFEIHNPEKPRKEDDYVALTTKKTNNNTQLQQPPPKAEKVTSVETEEVKETSSNPNSLVMSTDSLRPKMENDIPTTSLEVNHGGNSDSNSNTNESKSNKRSVLSESVNLVAPVVKKNSLLDVGGGAIHRSRYVGSHFNTKHSNMGSTLFRQVKQPVPKQKKVVKKEQQERGGSSFLRSSNQKGKSKSKSKPTDNSKQSRTSAIMIPNPPSKTTVVGATRVLATSSAISSSSLSGGQQFQSHSVTTMANKRKKGQCFHVASDRNHHNQCVDGGGTKKKKKKTMSVQETPLSKHRGRNNDNNNKKNGQPKGGKRMIVYAARTALKRQN